jgi:hypothetical protein
LEKYIARLTKQTRSELESNASVESAIPVKIRMNASYIFYKNQLENLQGKDLFGQMSLFYNLAYIDRLEIIFCC